MTAGSSDSPVTAFTSLDYASVEQDLTRFALRKFGINLTNYSPSEPLVVIVGMLSYVTDLLAYTENQHTQEAIPVRALRMENFRDAVKPLGFVTKGPSPATTSLNLVFDPVVIAAGDITVTPAHKVKNGSGVPYQPTGTTVFPMGGATTGSVDIQQGETFTEVLAVASPGTQSQSYFLSQYPVLESSIRVIVDGTEWQESSSSVAIDSATSTTYDVHFDGDWRARIVFGDGANGLIPPVGVEISVIYDTCLGSDGASGADTITTISSMPTGVDSVTNSIATSPGESSESLSTAKARLPGATRTNNRAVSLVDYASEARKVEGVSKAIAVLGPSGLGGCGCAYVIYAVTAGGGVLTSTIKNNVIRHLRNIGLPGKRILVSDAGFTSLEVEIDVYVKSVSSANTTKLLVQSEVLDAYDFSSLDFGVTLPLQPLYDLLDPSLVAGVERVLVRRFTTTPTFGLYTLNRPTGNGQVVNAIHGIAVEIASVTVGLSYRAEWKITITDGGGPTGPATFTVTRRRLGVASEVSDDSVIDDTALYVANEFVDYTTTFRYRPYDLDSGTFPVLGNTSVSVSLDMTGSLQDYLQPGEEFCLEASAGTGRCYRDSWEVPGGGYAVDGDGSTGAPHIIAAPGSGWAVSDKVHIESDDGFSLYAEITGGTTGSWQISEQLPAFAAGVALTMTCVFDYLTLFKFELLQGSTRWQVGDTFFIDTHPLLSDIALRSQVYPELSSSNLSIRTIGGRI